MCRKIFVCINAELISMLKNAVYYFIPYKIASFKMNRTQERFSIFNLNRRKVINIAQMCHKTKQSFPITVLKSLERNFARSVKRKSARTPSSYWTKLCTKTIYTRGKIIAGPREARNPNLDSDQRIAFYACAPR